MTMNTIEETKKRWIKEIKPILVGRTIIRIRYLSDSECKDMGWYNSSIVLELDNGTLLFPSADDEGNDAGALFTSHKDMQTIPVI